MVTKVKITLSESEVLNLISALDVYTHNIDEPDLVELRGKLHTSLTLARIDEIDAEDEGSAKGFENGCEGCKHFIESTRIECTYYDKDLNFEDVDEVAKEGCEGKDVVNE